MKLFFFESIFGNVQGSGQIRICLHNLWLGSQFVFVPHYLKIYKCQKRRIQIVKVCLHIHFSKKSINFKNNKKIKKIVKKYKCQK